MEKTIQIPTNYTDAGSLLGMFEIRNTVECLVVCIPVLWAVLSLSPFGLTGTVILASVLVFPIGGFAITGIYDHSLFTFLKLYYRWRKKRGILLYKGNKPISMKEARLWE